MRKLIFAGGTAVITGAASGIGEALSHALARRGSNLVLLDRDAERLAAVAKSIQHEHTALQVVTYSVDLADAEATSRVAGAVLEEHPRIRLLVNNAGVALAGRFDQVTLDEFEWVIDTNFRAVVRLAHTLLPALLAEPDSHLVNVSSVFGLYAPAGQTAYAASKFAIRGFTQALRHELGEYGIGVTSVHPGGVRTRIAESARVGSGVSPEEHEIAQEEYKKLPAMPPVRAAELIAKGIERRRARILIGWSARLADVLARLLPTAHGTILHVLALRLVSRRDPRPTRITTTRQEGW